MSVHQCPRCPLRFSYRTELEFHLREDHDRELHAVAASASAASTRSRVSPSPAGQPSSSRPELEHLADLPQRKAGGDIHSIDRPFHPVTVMPRWVALALIALVVAGLGLGLLFGS